MIQPTAQTPLTEWLTFIDQQHPKTIDLTLDRVSMVADLLGLTKPKPWIITVSGTNGKGSCCALLEAILLAAGYRVGVYTSPHLLQYNERVRINGSVVNDASLCHAFSVIQQQAKQTTLTYFEYGTLAALYLFQQQPLDVLVLEVGLGGRFDAVNIIDADVAVVTTIDFDHQQWLGDTREAIAKEKAGIFRALKPAVCGDPNPPESLIETAYKLDTRLFCQERDFSYRRGASGWDWFSDNKDYRDLPLPKIHLQNASTVFMALACLPELNIKEQAIRQGLMNIQQIARQQLIPGKPSLVLDVAHNPQSTTYLADMVKTLPYARKNAVVAMLGDKDITKSLAPLIPHINQWFVAGLDVFRGTTSEVIAEVLTSLNANHVVTFPTVTEAFQAALTQTNPEDVVIVFGSFYTVAEVFPLLP